MLISFVNPYKYAYISFIYSNYLLNRFKVFVLYSICLLYLLKKIKRINNK